MGAIRKLTGAQAQVDAYRKNTKMTVQAQTVAAQETANAAMSQARATALATSAASQREQAAQTVAETLDTPMEVAQVSVGGAEQLTAEARRRKRSTFGTNYLQGLGL